MWRHGKFFINFLKPGIFNEKQTSKLRNPEILYLLNSTKISELHNSGI